MSNELTNLTLLLLGKKFFHRLESVQSQFFEAIALCQGMSQVIVYDASMAAQALDAETSPQMTPLMIEKSLQAKVANGDANASDDKLLLGFSYLDLQKMSSFILTQF